MRIQRVGGAQDRSGFPAAVHGVRASDHDRAQAGREKCERNKPQRVKSACLSLKTMVSLEIVIY